MEKEEIYDDPEMEFNVGLQKYVPKIQTTIKKSNKNITSNGSEFFIILILVLILLIFLIKIL